MKAQSEATIRFSGYPLRIVETKQKTARAELIVIRSSAIPSPFTKNKVTNDPGNWDIGWFANYE
jgi:hypothetical protein